ncbi:MFS transporter [Occultella kanbiaonis]|uniref:MFS transporter n=1 Tax=Occultella kanbiaonis TaxID=2675754 RepID=UPI0013D2074B|nr:MFS transporter [Occultella kanbiaonis]
MVETSTPDPGADATAAAGPPDPADKPRTLWHHRDFRHLWAGDALGQLGAQFTGLALPVLAVGALQATEWQMGVLSAANMAAFLLIGLPAGAWVDRMRKRSVLITADLFRAVILAGVVVAALAGAASMPLLYVAGLLLGSATVFFDVAHQSYVPALVGMDHVVEGNAKLQATASVAQVAGPAAAGVLLRFVTSGALIGFNALTYVFSALFVSRIAHRETLPPREERRPLVVEIREGLSFVLREPLLRRMVACTALGNLAWGILSALQALYILRDLDLGEAALGTIFSAASVGALIGALLGRRAAEWIGEARLVPVSAVAMGIPIALVPLASVLPVPPTVTLIVGLGLSYTMMVVYNIATVSFRQRLCPPRLLGRMNASVRFIVWGTMPFGGLLGGWLGSSFGVVGALWFAVIGTLLAALPVVISPLWTMTTLPTAADDDRGATAGTPAGPGPID